MKPRVKENIRAVIPFLSLWATRFFRTIYFTDFGWKRRTTLATAEFIKGMKLITSVAKAKIIPNRMNRKIVIAIWKLKDTRDLGSR